MGLFSWWTPSRSLWGRMMTLRLHWCTRRSSECLLAIKGLHTKIRARDPMTIMRMRVGVELNKLSYSRVRPSHLEI